MNWKQAATRSSQGFAVRTGEDGTKMIRWREGSGWILPPDSGVWHTAWRLELDGFLDWCPGESGLSLPTDMQVADRRTAFILVEGPDRWEIDSVQTHTLPSSPWLQKRLEELAERGRPAHVFWALRPKECDPFVGLPPDAWAALLYAKLHREYTLACVYEAERPFRRVWTARFFDLPDWLRFYCWMKRDPADPKQPFVFPVDDELPPGVSPRLAANAVPDVVLRLKFDKLLTQAHTWSSSRREFSR